MYEDMMIVKAPKIRGIVVEHDDVTFYFEDSDEAFSVGEFIPDTPTRRALEEIERSVLDYNARIALDYKRRD